MRVQSCIEITTKCDLFVREVSSETFGWKNKGDNTVYTVFAGQTMFVGERNVLID